MVKALKTRSKAWRTIDLDEETAAAMRVHLRAQEFQRRSCDAAYVSSPRCGKQIEAMARRPAEWHAFV